jgi:hypothetical protein
MYTPLPDIRLEEAAKPAALLRASLYLVHSCIMRMCLEHPNPKLISLLVLVGVILRLGLVLVS